MYKTGVKPTLFHMPVCMPTHLVMVILVLEDTVARCPTCKLTIMAFQLKSLIDGDFCPYIIAWFPAAISFVKNYKIIILEVANIP